MERSRWPFHKTETLVKTSWTFPLTTNWNSSCYTNPWKMFSHTFKRDGKLAVLPQQRCKWNERKSIGRYNLIPVRLMSWLCTDIGYVLLFVGIRSSTKNFTGWSGRNSCRSEVPSWKCKAQAKRRRYIFSCNSILLILGRLDMHLHCHIYFCLFQNLMNGNWQKWKQWFGLLSMD